MSYTRFAIGSDIYVYCSGEDTITIHVAGRRKVAPDNFPPNPYSVAFSQKPDVEIDYTKLVEDYREWRDKVDKLPFEDIVTTQKYDGTYCAEGAVHVIRQLRAEGLHIPEGIEDEIKEDFEEEFIK